MQPLKNIARIAKRCPETSHGCQICQIALSKSTKKVFKKWLRDFFVKRLCKKKRKNDGKKNGIYTSEKLFV